MLLIEPNGLDLSRPGRAAATHLLTGYFTSKPHQLQLGVAALGCSKRYAAINWAAHVMKSGVHTRAPP